MCKSPIARVTYGIGMNPRIPDPCAQSGRRQRTPLLPPATIIPFFLDAALCREIRAAMDLGAVESA
jgi:hypothetical protein